MADNYINDYNSVCCNVETQFIASPHSTNKKFSNYPLFIIILVTAPIIFFVSGGGGVDSCRLEDDIFITVYIEQLCCEMCMVKRWVGWGQIFFAEMENAFYICE